MQFFAACCSAEVPTDFDVRAPRPSATNASKKEALYASPSTTTKKQLSKHKKLLETEWQQRRPARAAEYQRQVSIQRTLSRISVSAFSFHGSEGTSGQSGRAVAGGEGYDPLYELSPNHKPGDDEKRGVHGSVMGCFGCYEGKVQPALPRAGTGRQRKKTDGVGEKKPLNHVTGERPAGWTKDSSSHSSVEDGNKPRGLGANHSLSDDSVPAPPAPPAIVNLPPLEIPALPSFSPPPSRPQNTEGRRKKGAKVAKWAISAAPVEKVKLIAGNPPKKMNMTPTPPHSPSFSSSASSAVSSSSYSSSSSSRHYVKINPLATDGEGRDALERSLIKRVSPYDSQFDVLTRSSGLAVKKAFESDSPHARHKKFVETKLTPPTKKKIQFPSEGEGQVGVNGRNVNGRGSVAHGKALPRPKRPSTHVVKIDESQQLDDNTSYESVAGSGGEKRGSQVTPRVPSTVPTRVEEGEPARRVSMQMNLNLGGEGGISPYSSASHDTSSSVSGGTSSSERSHYSFYGAGMTKEEKKRLQAKRRERRARREAKNRDSDNQAPTLLIKQPTSAQPASSHQASLQPTSTQPNPRVMLSTPAGTHAVELQISNPTSSFSLAQSPVSGKGQQRIDEVEVKLGEKMGVNVRAIVKEGGRGTFPLRVRKFLFRTNLAEGKMTLERMGKRKEFSMWSCTKVDFTVAEFERQIDGNMRKGNAELESFVGDLTAIAKFDTHKFPLILNFNSQADRSQFRSLVLTSQEKFAFDVVDG